MHSIFPCPTFFETRSFLPSGASVTNTGNYAAYRPDRDGVNRCPASKMTLSYPNSKRFAPLIGENCFYAFGYKPLRINVGAVLESRWDRSRAAGVLDRSDAGSRYSKESQPLSIDFLL